MRDDTEAYGRVVNTRGNSGKVALNAGNKQYQFLRMQRSKYQTNKGWTKKNSVLKNAKYLRSKLQTNIGSHPFLEF